MARGVKTKEEFIIECSMKNLEGAIANTGTLHCYKNKAKVVERCYMLAVELANKVYP